MKVKMNKEIIQVNSFFMANDKVIKKVTGRLYFDYVVLTIHKDTTEYQLNNICWLENNVLANIESARNMPLVAQFIDENKSEPWGHGYPTMRNGQAVILDSEQIGSVVDVEIKDIQINENQDTIKALVASGYVNEIRYPELSKWLKAKMFDKEAVSTSVEIVPKKGNERIIYESVNNSQGELIDIPVEFDFAGSAILSVTPADSNAIVLEINSAKEQKQKEDEKMEKELQEKIDLLEKDVAAKDIMINELEENKVTLETEKAELETEKNTLEAEKSELEEKVATLETEKVELEKFKDEKSKEEILEKFEEETEIFSDELKEEVKEEIEALKSEPTSEKSEAIINSLNAKFVKKSIEEKAKLEKEEEENELRLNSLFVSTVTLEKEETSDKIKVWE